MLLWIDQHKWISHRKSYFVHKYSVSLLLIRGEAAFCTELYKLYAVLVSFSDVYLDGNELGCFGTVDVISYCAQQAKRDYQVMLDKLEEERLKKEEEEKLAFESISFTFYVF